MNIRGIIFASDNEVKLNELTIHRTTASLPFGGRYRLIDFALSNFVNSGVTNIGIIAKNNYESLMDHLRMGRDWDLNRKNAGIAVFPPFVHGTSEVYKGKIDALSSIMSYITSGKEDYIYITNGNVALNIDINDIAESFERHNADIVMVAHRHVPSTSRRVIVSADADGRVRELLISEGFSAEKQLVSLNSYLIRKDLLVGMIRSAYSRNMTDFEKDILQRKADSLNIYCHEVDCAYVIDDVKSYYAASMSLLDDEVRDELFYKCGRIYTKVKDSAPTVYKSDAEVSNSLIADGCVIDGTVVNSILFRGVVVEKGAVIKDSIVMQRCVIKQDSSLSNVITDKNVIVTKGRTISGTETYPIVIVKDKTV